MRHSIAAFGLAACLLLFVSPSYSQVPSGAWNVSMTATGGELGRAVETIEILFDQGQATATSKRGSPGAMQTSALPVSVEAYTRLWAAIEASDAWNLADLDVDVLDFPDYTVELRAGNKTRLIQMRGANTSDAHLKLLLAIEECVEQQGGQK